MGAITHIVHGALLDAWAHLSDGVWPVVIALAVLLGVDLKNLFVRWRLERRLERGIDLTWEDVQYLKAQLETEGEVERKFKPREALLNLLVHTSVYVGLGMVFAIGKELGLPAAVYGLGFAAAFGGMSYWTFVREVPNAIGYFDAQEIRQKGHWFGTLAVVALAFSLLTLFA
jgi:hypothetical protein